MKFFFIIHFHDDAGSLAQDVDALDQAVQAVRGLHLVPGMGKGLVEFLVDLGLVFEAAHEPSAHARDLARIERKVLFLGHLNGDGHKIGKPGMAAERPAAASVSAQNLGLVSDTHLAQLDARAEYTRQILDQFAEIHAAVRGEIKQHFAVVKSIFGIDQLHIQAAALDLFAADPEGFALTLAVFLLADVILFRADPDHRLEGLGDILLIHFHGGTHDKAVLQPSGCLHDHVLAA